MTDGDAMSACLTGLPPVAGPGRWQRPAR